MDVKPIIKQDPKAVVKVYTDREYMRRVNASPHAVYFYTDTIYGKGTLIAAIGGGTVHYRNGGIENQTTPWPADRYNSIEAIDRRDRIIVRFSVGFDPVGNGRGPRLTANLSGIERMVAEKLIEEHRNQLDAIEQEFLAHHSAKVRNSVDVNAWLVINREHFNRVMDGFLDLPALGITLANDAGRLASRTRPVDIAGHADLVIRQGHDVAVDESGTIVDATSYSKDKGSEFSVRVFSPHRDSFWMLDPTRRKPIRIEATVNHAFRPCIFTATTSPDNDGNFRTEWSCLYFDEFESMGKDDQETALKNIGVYRSANEALTLGGQVAYDKEILEKLLREQNLRHAETDHITQTKTRKATAFSTYAKSIKDIVSIVASKEVMWILGIIAMPITVVGGTLLGKKIRGVNML